MDGLSAKPSLAAQPLPHCPQPLGPFQLMKEMVADELNNSGQAPERRPATKGNPAVAKDAVRNHAREAELTADELCRIEAQRFGSMLAGKGGERRGGGAQ